MERKHEKYENLIARCKALSAVPTAVAHPCDESSLRGAVEAAEMGILQPILVGPRDRIQAVAAKFKLDISGYQLVDTPHSVASAEMAVQLAREGKAEMLMKGSLHTDELMAAVVRGATGLRTSTVEAAALCKMADRKQITGGVLDGPLALDNAIDLTAAKIKKIDSPVAGMADILVVPDLEAGNMLAKSLSFMADADAAGIVLGARVPIILTSRADSVMTRLASCAVAALVAQARRASAGKAVSS
ncbi:MAG: phosphate acetyltransferase [Sulfuritalea sp.]|nr:phosphate acetyltransferase [Sulfuritalea sp.]